MFSEPPNGSDMDQLSGTVGWGTLYKGSSPRLEKLPFNFNDTLAKLS